MGVYLPPGDARVSLDSELIIGFACFSACHQTFKALSHYGIFLPFGSSSRITQQRRMGVVQFKLPVLLL